MVSCQRVAETSRFILSQDSFTDFVFLQHILIPTMKKRFWNMRLLLSNQGCLGKLCKHKYMHIHINAFISITDNDTCGWRGWCLLPV